MNDEKSNPSQDYHLPEIPGYMEWSKRMLHKGESADLIAHLDATSMCLRRTDVPEITEVVFEELLLELKMEVDEEE